MTYNRIIKDYLRRVGQAVAVQSGDTAGTVWAIAEQRNRKTKTLFEDKTETAGRYYNDYYTYIGPADFDITALSEDTEFLVGGRRFALIKAEPVRGMGELLYYEGILKKIREGTDVFTTGM